VSQVQRVVVIGPGGAGKSVLARRLGSAWGLPVRHLDAAFWAPGWRPTPPEVWRDVVTSLAAGEAWIIEGGYPEVLDILLDRAQLALVLDLPRWLTLPRLVLRPVRRRDRDRGDLPRGMRHVVDRENLSWAWRWPTLHRPAVVQAVLAFEAAGGRATVVRSRGGVRRAARSEPPSMP